MELVPEQPFGNLAAGIRPEQSHGGAATKSYDSATYGTTEPTAAPTSALAPMVASTPTVVPACLAAFTPVFFLERRTYHETPAAAVRGAATLPALRRFWRACWCPWRRFPPCLPHWGLCRYNSRSIADRTGYLACLLGGFNGGAAFSIKVAAPEVAPSLTAPPASSVTLGAVSVTPAALNFLPVK